MGKLIVVLVCLMAAAKAYADHPLYRRHDLSRRDAFSHESDSPSLQYGEAGTSAFLSEPYARTSYQYDTPRQRPSRTPAAPKPSTAYNRGPAEYVLYKVHKAPERLNYRQPSPPRQFGAPLVRRRFNQYLTPANLPSRATQDITSESEHKVNCTDESSPAKYQYSYTVLAPEYKVSFGHEEERAGDVVVGGYYALLPDGRTQRVEYVADKNGYRPTITYVSQPTEVPQQPASQSVVLVGGIQHTQQVPVVQVVSQQPLVQTSSVGGSQQLFVQGPVFEVASHQPAPPGGEAQQPQIQTATYEVEPQQPQIQTATYQVVSQEPQIQTTTHEVLPQEPGIQAPAGEVTQQPQIQTANYEMVPQQPQTETTTHEVIPQHPQISTVTYEVVPQQPLIQLPEGERGHNLKHSQLPLVYSRPTQKE